MSCSHPQEDADDSESNSICNTTFFVFAILIPVAFSFLILWKRFGVKLYEIVTFCRHIQEFSLECCTHLRIIYFDKQLNGPYLIILISNL